MPTTRRPFLQSATRLATARPCYSHHNLELKDVDTFHFGEASRL
jgi:hypothetical protein